MGTINIPTLLKIEAGALSNIGDFLASSGLKKVVIYFGNGLIDMFGTQVMDSLRQAEVEVLEYRELDTVDINDITKYFRLNHNDIINVEFTIK